MNLVSRGWASSTMGRDTCLVCKKPWVLVSALKTKAKLNVSAVGSITHSACIVKVEN